MNANKLDIIIDNILNDFYVEVVNNPTIKILETKKVVQFTDYHKQINDFAEKYIQTINLTELNSIVDNKKNVVLVFDIIKKYIYYYLFMYIAVNYTGTQQEYLNNIVQFSKLNISTVNFFDSDNNYKLFEFYELLKNTTAVLLMTDAEKREDIIKYKSAKAFLSNFPEEHIEQYMLSIGTTNNKANSVYVNNHNLIKLMIFLKLYQEKERPMIINIMNEIEENDKEYTYIDIVVTIDNILNESVLEMLLSDTDNQIDAGVGVGVDISENARALAELLNKSYEMTTSEEKTNYILTLPGVMPIVDNFLRYHRDSEFIDISEKAILAIGNTNQINNVKMIILNQKKKKNENTKANVVITQTEHMADLYSPHIQKNTSYVESIKKLFFQPLEQRKAVSINFLEESKVYIKEYIMDSLTTSATNAKEMAELIFNAYINYKNFIGQGFHIEIITKNPIKAFRYANIEYISYENATAETINVGNKTYIPVTGLALATYEPTIRKNIIDIRKIKIDEDTDNAVKKFIKIFKITQIDTIEYNFNSQLIFNDYDKIDKKYEKYKNKVIYWLFDTSKDKIKGSSYNDTDDQSIIERQLKLICSSIHDKIVNHLKTHIKNMILILRKKDQVSNMTIYNIVYAFYERFNLKFDDIAFYQEYIVDIVRNNNINEKLYEPINYDQTELSVFTDYVEKKNNKICIDMRYIEKIILCKNIYDSKRKDVVLSNERVRCKHSMDWYNLKKIKTNDINLYNRALSDFIAKYSGEAYNSLFFCKICGEELDIVEYSIAGKFDDNTQRVITEYTPYYVPLEDTKGYTKYKNLISSLNQLTDKLVFITNTNVFSTMNAIQRQKKKLYVKNVIDLLVENNLSSKNVSFDHKKYGISADHDIFFYFDIDNNLFMQDKNDSRNNELKRLNLNMVILYLIYLFLPEFNGLQILSMYYDKYANIYSYEKIKNKLFADLKIKLNTNSNNTDDILNYPVLCYLLFVLSYLTIKYNVWYYRQTGEKMLLGLYQKVFINTFVHLLNNISLESGLDKNNYVYSLTVTKFYSRLNNLFGNNDIIVSLHKSHHKYSNETITEDIQIKTTGYKVSDLVLKPQTYTIFMTRSGFGNIYGSLFKKIYKPSENNSSVIICPEGTYHTWKMTDGNMKCSICGEKLDDESYDIDRTDALYLRTLYDLSKMFCVSGSRHEFANGICTNCNKKNNEKYSENELNDMIINLTKKQDYEYEPTTYEVKSSTKNVDILIKDYDTLTKNISVGAVNHMVSEFIKLVVDYIGSDVNTSNNKEYPVYLHDDVYIIDHNFDGTEINPIMIRNSENKIIYKQNHTYFKKDVLYYTDHKHGMDIFYDAYTYKILGFKENQKEYEKYNSMAEPQYLIVIQSFKKRLINLSGTEIYKKTNNNISINYIRALIRTNIVYMKNVISDIIMIHNKIYNNKNDTIDTNKDVDIVNDPTIDEKNISNIIEKHKSNPCINSTTFSDWINIKNELVYTDTDWSKTNLMDNKEYIKHETIMDYDKTSSVLLFYYLKEIQKLVTDSTDTIKSADTIKLVLDIVNYIYETTHKESSKLAYKRFVFMLNGSESTMDMTKKNIKIKMLDDVEVEKIKKSDEDREDKIDDIEAAQALDLETPDYERDDDYADEPDETD
jgi:hypothetical protein